MCMHIVLRYMLINFTQERLNENNIIKLSDIHCIALILFQFSYIKITVHTVQVELVTVQQDSRQAVDSSARVKSPCLRLS